MDIEKFPILEIISDNGDSFHNGIRAVLTKSIRQTVDLVVVYLQVFDTVDQNTLLQKL